MITENDIKTVIECSKAELSMPHLHKKITEICDFALHAIKELEFYSTNKTLLHVQDGGRRARHCLERLGK